MKQKHNTKRNKKRKCPKILDKKVLFPIASYFKILLYITKFTIYKPVMRPVAMYGSECWAIKKKDERNLHVEEMRIFRWMCGVTRIDELRNEYIRVAPITEKLKGIWFELV
jgi:Zn-dependent peptidase ImmA (M78 family)